MPISGYFWTQKELQEGLGITKQGVSNLARRHGWESPYPGLYVGGPADIPTTVDGYLHARARKSIKGQRALDWDDSFDMNCPVEGCYKICLQWPDDFHYKCAGGHIGNLLT